MKKTDNNNKKNLISSPKAKSVQHLATSSTPNLDSNTEASQFVNADIRFGPSVKFSLSIAKPKDQKYERRKSWNSNSREQEQGKNTVVTWYDVKEESRKHPLVLGFFKQIASKNLKSEDFSLVVSASTEELLITPGSYLEAQEAKRSNEQEQKANSFNASTSSNWRKKSHLSASNTDDFSEPLQVLLVYAPRIHLCTYDGLQISLPTLGHWLHVHDTKSQTKLVGSSSSHGDSSQQALDMTTNDLLLFKENSTIMCQFLQRLNQFFRSELCLEADSYAVCIPFGNFKSELCTKDAIHARVQLANPKIFWELLMNFEDKLSNENDMGIQYIVHQRETWTTLRFNDYRRWSSKDRDMVRQEYDALLNHRSINPRVVVPDQFFFDGNRMQIHYEATQSLDTMHGAMGSVSNALRALVDEYQLLADRIGTRDFHLIIHGRASHFSLSPKRYIQILSSSGGDALEWGNKIMNTLSAHPERLFSGLLAEGAGLIHCDVNSLRSVLTEEGAPLPPKVLNSLKERNKVDKRLRLDLKNRMSSSNVSTGTGGSSGMNRNSVGGYNKNYTFGSSNRTNWRDNIRATSTYNPGSNDNKYRPNSYASYNDTMSRDNHVYEKSAGRAYVTSPINSPPRRHETWEDQVDGNYDSGRNNYNDRGGQYGVQSTYPSTQQYGAGAGAGGMNRYNSSSDKSSAPGPGYSCRICGQQGGLPDSHWFQQCPMAEEAAMGSSLSGGRGGNDLGGKRPPGLGYSCKICGQKGGTPDSHWVQQCPEAVNDGEKQGGGFSDFWKDRSPSTPNWQF